uniref:Uncharacterized protein n=1 Tax=Gloeothece verrucosa (strain PCC 7822) TaxID=497965 RepID=E0UM55_GLOV7|nr:hypothetical protein Cyan7822_6232 [Gloeothece verrucosa PCC 7822]
MPAHLCLQACFFTGKKFSCLAIIASRQRDTFIDNQVLTRALCTKEPAFIPQLVSAHSALSKEEQL